MSETPDADVILPSGAKPDACFGEDEDSDSCFELEGCFDGDEDQDSDCSGCSTATVRSSPRLALEAAEAAAEVSAAAAREALDALPPPPSPFEEGSDMEEELAGGGMEEELDTEVECLGTFAAAPLKEPLAIKENLGLDLEVAEKPPWPPWNFTAVDNNLGCDAHGQPMTEAHEQRYLQDRHARAKKQRRYWNGQAGLDGVALLCGLDPSEVADREVAEAEAAAAAAEGAAAAK